jgi:hypothetical protein
MSDRLREIVKSGVLRAGIPGQEAVINNVENALRSAGVTLPPEPDIPVPDDAVEAYYRIAFPNIPSTLGIGNRLRAIGGLRAAYPHIVAAMIDALPQFDSATRSKLLPGGAVISPIALHRALKSSKANA